MSTIASPRNPTSPLLHRTHSSQAITSPNSSGRPSLEISRSATSSPVLNAAPQSSAATKRSNRAALREYYKLKNHPQSGAGAGAPPLLEVTDVGGDPAQVQQQQHYHHHGSSDVAASELDAADFDAEAYVTRALEAQGLGELLRTYARVLGETRALDAEKKALVYDNYSKLITATETIRKMRANMDPLTPVAATLDPAIAQVYVLADRIRETARARSGPRSGADGKDKDKGKGQGHAAVRGRTREVVREVLGASERVRTLVRQGRYEDAKREWALPRRLLNSWKEKGVGGDDVQACIEDGEAALRGEDGRSSAS